MKKSFGIVSIMSTLLISAAAFAAQPVPAPGNSTPGIDRDDNNPGRQQAGAVGAQCGTGAGSGAFGFLGNGNSEAGGANGIQTGLNNSALCGNRQGNLP